MKFYADRVWSKEHVITFWERSGSYSGYKKNPKFLEMHTDGGSHSISAF